MVNGEQRINVGVKGSVYGQFEVISQQCPEESAENHWNVSQNNRSSYRGLNLGPIEWKGCSPLNFNAWWVGADRGLFETAIAAFTGE
jgi:hypothetical protein